MGKVGLGLKPAATTPLTTAPKRGRLGTFTKPEPPQTTTPPANGPLGIQPKVRTMQAAVAAKKKDPPPVTSTGGVTADEVATAVLAAGYKIDDGVTTLQGGGPFCRRIRGVYPASLPIGICKHCVEGPTKPEAADKDRRLHLAHADSMTIIVPAWEAPVKGPSPGLGLCLGYQLTRELRVYLDPVPEKMIMRSYNVKAGNLLVLPATPGHMLASEAVRDYTATEGPLRWAELMAAHPLLRDMYVGSIGLHFRPIIVVSAIPGLGIQMDKVVAPATVIKTGLMLSPSTARILNDFKGAYGQEKG